LPVVSRFLDAPPELSRPATKRIRGAIAAVLAGDVSALTLVAFTQPHDVVAAVGRAPLVLPRDAVVDVLRRYASGELHSRDVARWAFFLRHGWLAGTRGISPRLNIDWEAAYEDSIVAALNWLAELGDDTDPTLREDEIAALVGGLS
jgi:hypothetical protein